MEEKKVKVGDKEYTVKEIKYIQAVELEGLERKEMAKKLLIYSVGLTDKEIDELPLKVGMQLQNEVNNVNNISADFQKPADTPQS